MSSHPKTELLFDGQLLTWAGHGHFRATSGLTGHQSPDEECTPEAGPTPQGLYVVPLTAGWARAAKIDPSVACRILPGRGWERIPRGTRCEPYFANWGYNRVRFYAADVLTQHRCTPTRDGFYLHDSTKGFSHGCIEVENRFFGDIASLASSGRVHNFMLTVRYVAGRPTYGGTRS
jgi:hypothetical protein